jgi:hypothetical protein
MAAFGFLVVGTAIGCACHYWFTKGRDEDFLLGRIKTTFAFVCWFIYLPFVLIRSVSGGRGAG